MEKTVKKRQNSRKRKTIYRNWFFRTFFFLETLSRPIKTRNWRIATTNNNSNQRKQHKKQQVSTDKWQIDKPTKRNHCIRIRMTLFDDIFTKQKWILLWQVSPFLFPFLTKTEKLKVTGLKIEIVLIAKKRRGWGCLAHSNSDACV